jgi:hypothetical protein
MTLVVEDLSILLAKFEISKGLLSPHDRRSMRQYFLNLAEQYHKESDGTRAVFLAQQLADHAYKQPECK